MGCVRKSSFTIFYLLLVVLYILKIGCAEESIPRRNGLDTSQDLNGFILNPYSIQNVTTLLSRLIELTSTEITSKTCIDDLKTTLHKAAQADISALQILDSWGKPSSGLLEGNLNQYGSFDQCINSVISKEDVEIKGKYCLISFDINLPPYLEHYNDLIHSYFVFRNSLTDPAHRIPHFSNFKWGTCIPASCQAIDIQQVLGNVLRSVLPKHMTISTDAPENMCYVKQQNEFKELMWSLSIIAILIGICTLSSINMFCNNILIPQRLNKYVQCFSFKRNISILMDRKSDTHEISVINGIRVLSALGLLLSHKHMALLYNPFMNRTSMAKVLGYSWSVIGRTAIIYTDGFILLSGVLTTNSLLKELKKTNKIDFIHAIFSRIVRLTPNLMVVIMVCTWILPNLGYGPLWNMVITKHSELCKLNWWKNLLYIHNFFGFENMCLTHTHQLGIDFQLFLASIVIVYVTWKKRSIGYPTIIILAMFSTLLRYVVTKEKELSVIVYYGIEVSKLFNTANFSYILPTHRLTIYLIGVGLSFYLNNRGQGPLNKVYVFIGWIFAACCGIVAMFGPFHMCHPDYVYNSFEAAMYNSCSPILWGILISWTIIASERGYAGWFGRLLSWSWFKVMSKLTYTIYLVQFPVFFYKVGVTRNTNYYTPFEMLSIEEYISIIALSIILVLTVEMPLNNVNKLYWSTKNKKHDKIEIDLNKDDRIEHSKVIQSMLHKRTIFPLG